MDDGRLGFSGFIWTGMPPFIFDSDFGRWHLDLIGMLLGEMPSMNHDSRAPQEGGRFPFCDSYIFPLKQFGRVERFLFLFLFLSMLEFYSNWLFRVLLRFNLALVLLD